MKYVTCFATAILLMLMGIGLGPQNAYSQSPKSERLPEFSDFFDFGDGTADTSTIDPNERPHDPAIELPATLESVPVDQPANDLKELGSWIRWLALMNLPPSHEDNRKWGKQKEVVTGLDIHREGWRLDTKRKRKAMNHGTWSRYYVEFVDPQKNLAIEVKRCEVTPNGKTFTIEIAIIAPLKLFGRVSEWRRDVQLYSISANADATVQMQVACDIDIRINPLRFPPDVEFRPKVTKATVELLEFEVHNISQMRGPMAELLGKGIRQMLDARLESYSDKLVDKMNETIAKQQSKLKLSTEDWFKTALKKRLE